jgi:hypothetical protein
MNHGWVEFNKEKIDLSNIPPKIRNLKSENFHKFASKLPQSCYNSYDGYSFCRTVLNLNILPNQLGRNLRPFSNELFSKEIYWWISCGNTGSNTPAHDDPLEISRGFLAVIRGFKVMLVWSKSSKYENPGDQKEIIELANDYLFLNTSKGDGYKNTSLETLRKKFQTFNKIYKYQGKIIEIREGEVIIFDASQKHAVVNFEDDTVAISGEIWKKDDSQKFRKELEQLEEKEKLKGDKTGSTAQWALSNYDKIESAIREKYKMNPKHHLLKRNFIKSDIDQNDRTDKKMKLSK